MYSGLREGKFLDSCCVPYRPSCHTFLRKSSTHDMQHGKENSLWDPLLIHGGRLLPAGQLRDHGISQSAGGVKPHLSAATPAPSPAWVPCGSRCGGRHRCALARAPPPSRLFTTPAFLACRCGSLCHARWRVIPQLALVCIPRGVDSRAACRASRRGLSPALRAALARAPAFAAALDYAAFTILPHTTPAFHLSGTRSQPLSTRYRQRRAAHGRGSCARRRTGQQAGMSRKANQPPLSQHLHACGYRSAVSTTATRRTRDLRSRSLLVDHVCLRLHRSAWDRLRLIHTLHFTCHYTYPHCCHRLQLRTFTLLLLHRHSRVTPPLSPYTGHVRYVLFVSPTHPTPRYAPLPTRFNTPLLSSFAVYTRPLLLCFTPTRGLYGAWAVLLEPSLWLRTTFAQWCPVDHCSQPVNMLAVEQSISSMTFG